MRIGEATVLVTDLVAARAQQGDVFARDTYHRMLKETQPGQTWGILVPSEFLDEAALPNGLVAQVMLPGVTSIVGHVRAPKHTLEHALKSCYCDREDITSCVICGKPWGVAGVVDWRPSLSESTEREYTDTCSERCYQRLVAKQRTSWGG